MGWQVSSALQTVTWITLSPPTLLYLFSLIFAMSALSCICICKLSLERLCPHLQLHAFVVVIAIVNRYCCWALPVLGICLFVCYQWIPFLHSSFIVLYYFIKILFLRAEKTIQSDRVTKITCIFYSLLYFLRAKRPAKRQGHQGYFCKEKSLRNVRIVLRLHISIITHSLRSYQAA